MVGGRLIGKLDLYVRVGLGGAIEHAHGLGLGKELYEQVELVRDGGEVRGAGDVLAGLVVALDKTSRREVGDGGADDGDLVGGAGDGLGGGCRDREDEVITIVHELVGDRLTGGLIVLGVLLIDVVGDAGFVERIDKALVGGVERGVLGELQHAYLAGASPLPL